MHLSCLSFFVLEFKDFTYIVDMLSVKMVEVKERPQFFERLCPRFFNSRVSQFVRKCVQHRYVHFIFDVSVVSEDDFNNSLIHESSRFQSLFIHITTKIDFLSWLDRN